MRLFVALELPSGVRSALGAWAAEARAKAGAEAEAARALPGLRLIDVGALHATLCFLGWRGAPEVDEIAAVCRAAVVPGTVPLSLGEALWLPPRRPRVLAVALQDASGSLSRLQAAVSAALAAGGHYQPETRRYLGHVTVGRVRRGARIRARPLPPPPTPTPFAAEAVTLYRSRLAPGGARYEALETIRLG